MRALTLTQPWAGLVASGVKLIENRPRRMIKREDFGSRFAIHASREIDEGVYPRLRSIDPGLISTTEPHGWWMLSRITSAVIAVATIVRDVTESEVATGALVESPEQCRWYMPPQIGYVLRDVIALEAPVPCRGFQGFWTLPDDVATKVGEQVCDECRGPGFYFLNGKPVACICMEQQT